ncbi:MAG TPA: EamA family transporter [Gemmatimonadales bacterium]|nr:EamA family transporter [Gemmatimonadales bacterium]
MSLAALVWLILGTIWGSTWLFIKVGLDSGLPPIGFAGLRFVVASTPLVIWLVLRRVKLPQTWTEWRLMIVTGLLTFTVNYALVFWGESHISSGLAAILYTNFPLFGIVIAHFMLPEEPMTLRKVGGVVLAVIGVALIFWNQIALKGPLALAGAAAIVVAGLGTAYADVLIKRSGTHIDPVTLTAVQMVIGWIPLVTLGIALEGNPLHYSWTVRGVIALCYLAIVGSSVTFVLLYWLIQRMQVTRTMLIPLLSTLIAVALGILVLGEAFSVRVVVGGIGVLGGLVLAVARPRLVR